MFLGQSGPHRGGSDYLAISFIKGYVLLTWDLGAGPRRIFTPRPVDERINVHSVHIGRWPLSCLLSRVARSTKSCQESLLQKELLSGESCHGWFTGCIQYSADRKKYSANRGIVNSGLACRQLSLLLVLDSWLSLMTFM